MVRNVSPTKATGGGGFEFEDRVAAFFMCHLLSGLAPIDPSFGFIKRIDFQVRADGWLLDDLLLTLKCDNEEIRCAFSVKSNPQFSKTSAPSEFVRDAWDQYLGESSSIFKKNVDRIGLITAPLGEETKTALENLLNKARSQKPKDLFRRIQVGGYISGKGRSIFQSFSCPQELAKKYSIDEGNIGELLSCIEHLQFDFEYTTSANLRDAISLLRGNLESNSLKEANSLWETLCGVANTTRPKGGYIDLINIIRDLRRRYRLKDFPEYSTIWGNIKRKTKDELDLIPDKIADTVSIDRSNEISEIINKLNKNDIIVLLGESGRGKIVIEKILTVTKYEPFKIVG